MYRYFEPILRVDFTALEDFHYQRGTPLSVPMSIFYDDKGQNKAENILEWQRKTKAIFKVYPMDGGHFFVLKHFQEILKIIVGGLNFQEEELGKFI